MQWVFKHIERRFQQLGSLQWGVVVKHCASYLTIMLWTLTALQVFSFRISSPTCENVCGLIVATLFFIIFQVLYANLMQPFTLPCRMDCPSSRMTYWNIYIHDKPYRHVLSWTLRISATKKGKSFNATEFLLTYIRNSLSLLC